MAKMFGILIFAILAITVSIVLYVCHKFHFFTLLLAWIKSTTEEKVGLAKFVGHFNANGYLVHSDSDIYIGHSGSFKRFESFDKDIRIATTSIVSVDWSLNPHESGIPPQPLRPAPVPFDAIRESSLDDKAFPTPNLSGCCRPPHLTIAETTAAQTETSIKPLPRPVSSINVNALQQSNAQFIQPPPTHTKCDPVASAITDHQLTNIRTIKDHPQDASQIELSINNHTSSPQNLPGVAMAIAGNSGDYVEVLAGVLKRAISCESVCSDTSVALADLEETNITGYLCIGLEYDSENCEMIANVLEAKDLMNPNIAISGPLRDEPLDTYVKIFLLPDKNFNVQTKLCRNSNSPSYQERVIFSLHPRDQMNTALLFHIYATDLNSHTLIGEGELSLADISLRQPVTTWVTLTDASQTGNEFGELMFSLSYLPTAERLTVVVVKGRKLRFHDDKVQGEPFVKAYLLQHGKKIHKKKTSSKKSEKSPIFNESMMFNIPSHMLQTIQLRLTVAELHPEASKTYSIGHVIVGAQASGRSLAHWNQMLQALRRPVAMWHALRK